MKRILFILLAIATAFTLWSCIGTTTTCTTHSDANGDLICDVCQAGIVCTDHVDTTEDGVYRCDKCKKAMICTDHTDDDNNGKCDKCSKKLPCTTHVDEDEDSWCDRCDERIICKIHTDEDEDFYCDKCEEEIDCGEHVDEDFDNACDECDTYLACKYHKDENNDLECDNCGAEVKCTEHADSDRNLKCDYCGVTVECTHIDSNNDSVCDVTGCGYDYGHTHSYSTDWSKDAENHWHAVTCLHNTPVADKAPHEDKNNDGDCDTCGWNNGHEHTYSDEWTYDATDHWHEASCDHTVAPADKAAHVDGDKDGLCETCHYQYCTHQFSTTEWTGDETGHWLKATCGHLVKPDTVENHTLNDDGICTVCSYDTQHEHTYEAAWSTTHDKHWHASTCGHTTKVSDEGAHVDTLDNNGICDVCQYQFCYHEYSKTPSYDPYDPDNPNGGYHWYAPTCGHDVEPYGKEEHVDENGDILCDVCSYNYGHSHTASEEWSGDETHHWHATDCEGHDEIKLDYEEHTDEDQNFYCDECGKFYEDLDPDLPDDYDDDEIIVMPPHYIGGNP